MFGARPPQKFKMPRTVEFEDVTRLELIEKLRQTAKNEKAGIWKRLADELSRPRRKRREVNLDEIGKNVKEGEAVVVPGKILGNGSLNHRINVAAFRFTEGAKQKIEKSGGKVLSIQELIKKNPKGSKIRIIG